jgi:hypothetical protein
MKKYYLFSLFGLNSTCQELQDYRWKTVHGPGHLSKKGKDEIAEDNFKKMRNTQRLKSKEDIFIKV